MKDHETAVSDGGERVYINKSGNSGMATGGSGDVLAGILGGLLAQNSKAATPLSLLEAVSLGVYIHGLAGDAAAIKLGEYSLMASDMIDALPSVLNFR
jgi:NAD(P)H-hydrate epimerase